MSDADEKKLLGRMARLIHGDDPERAEAYSMLLGADAPRYAELGIREQTFARMLFDTLWDDGGGFRTYDDGLDYLRVLRQRSRGRTSSYPRPVSADLWTP